MGDEIADHDQDDEDRENEFLLAPKTVWWKKRRAFSRLGTLGGGGRTSAPCGVAVVVTGGDSIGSGVAVIGTTDTSPGGDAFPRAAEVITATDAMP